MGSSRSAHRWHNWSRTYSAAPLAVVRPRDVDDVVAALRDAERDGYRVKAVGAGHSFTDIAVADGVQVDVSALDRIRRLDSATGLVTVEAGISLHRLSPLLWSAGLSLSSLGDIDQQSLGGAISTATHGTGLRFGSISSQVRALELVLADGSVVTCSPDERPDLFHAAMVGLGAFGVITAVTLQCAPAFGLHCLEQPRPLHDVLERLDELAGSADHVEFFWFPHTDVVLLKQSHRLTAGDPLDPVPQWRALLDDEVVANGALSLICRAGAAMPRSIPRLNRLAGRMLSNREYSDRSYRVFASPRRVRFRETEFGLPRAALPQVLAGIREWLERPGHGIGFPMEVRFGAPEESWLGPAYGRQTAWLAAHTYHRQPHEAFFRHVGRLADEAAGRPHWGKLHYQSAPRLRELYPRFGDALAVRDKVDPGRLFANDYLNRVLGA